MTFKKLKNIRLREMMVLEAIRAARITPMKEYSIVEMLVLIVHATYPAFPIQRDGVMVQKKLFPQIKKARLQCLINDLAAWDASHTTLCDQEEIAMLVDEVAEQLRSYGPRDLSKGLGLLQVDKFLRKAPSENFQYLLKVSGSLFPTCAESNRYLYALEPSEIDALDEGDSYEREDRGEDDFSHYPDNLS